MRSVFAAIALALTTLAVAKAGPLQVPANAAAVRASARDTGDVFDHARHAKLFPTCVVCHAGAVSSDQSIWPDSTECQQCHDGTVQRRIRWVPPVLPRTNLKFQHARHAQGVQAAGKTPPECINCHEQEGAQYMHIQLAALSRCFACHGVTAPHVSAPDTACARCHLSLPQATRITRADVASFPKPPSHDDSNWVFGEHGRRATAEPGHEIATSCTVCHARNFCSTCHVNAPENEAIQALEPDPRATAITATFSAPPSHHETNFLHAHGTMKLAGQGECSTCHTRESCLTCHLATPQVAAGLAPAGPGRARGAVVVRTKPAGHTDDFIQRRHGEFASARSATCISCHVRQDCLECHRSNAAGGARYHPADFLQRHPAAAYSRQTSCNDCHNTRQFCTACHAKAGLVATGPIGKGYHDGKPFFIAGHGQAARQNLESCTACHVENDCLKCHSATAGRHFNPHGPGFDAARLKLKNPEMCTVCHGTKIPG